MEHVQPAHPRYLPQRSVVVQPALHDVHDGPAAVGSERCVRRSLGRAARPACCCHCRRRAFRNRTCDRRHRPRPETIHPRVSGNGRDWRYRMRARLHLSGEHAGEVVSGSARNGHGHGHHGLRRRRVPRRVLERVLHRQTGRGTNGDRAGHYLSDRDADWRAHLAASAGRLAARRLDRSAQDRQDDHGSQPYAESSAGTGCNSICCGAFCSST